MDTYCKYTKYNKGSEFGLTIYCASMLFDNTGPLSFICFSRNYGCCTNVVWESSVKPPAKGIPGDVIRQVAASNTPYHQPSGGSIWRQSRRHFGMYFHYTLPGLISSQVIIRGTNIHNSLNQWQAFIQWDKNATGDIQSISNQSKIQQSKRSIFKQYIPPHCLLLKYNNARI